MSYFESEISRLTRRKSMEIGDLHVSARFRLSEADLAAIDQRRSEIKRKFKRLGRLLAKEIAQYRDRQRIISAKEKAREVKRSPVLSMNIRDFVGKLPDIVRNDPDLLAKSVEAFIKRTSPVKRKVKISPKKSKPESFADKADRLRSLRESEGTAVSGEEWFATINAARQAIYPKSHVSQCDDPKCKCSLIGPKNRSTLILPKSSLVTITLTNGEILYADAFFEIVDGKISAIKPTTICEDYIEGYEQIVLAHRVRV